MLERKSQGALTESVFYILLSLKDPLHGYGIMQNISKLSNGRIEMGAGTLYGAINTLLSRRWITPYEDNEKSRKKKYVLTEIGIEELKREIIRLEELIENGKTFLGELK